MRLKGMLANGLYISVDMQVDSETFGWVFNEEKGAILRKCTPTEMLCALVSIIQMPEATAERFMHTKETKEAVKEWGLKHYPQAMRQASRSDPGDVLQKAIDDAFQRLQKKRRQEEESPPPEMPTLDQWKVLPYVTRDGSCLSGYVKGHPRVPDGTFVETSTLQWIKPDLRLAQTRNTLYRLLEPAKENV